MNKYMEEAKAIRKSINGLAENIDNEKLIINKAAFPFWNEKGENYEIGEMVQYDDKLYKVIQAHISQSDWTPNTVPALFKEISLEEFPQWVQPTGAQDAYSKGDKCAHNNKHWESNVDGNVWEPGIYGWDELSL